MESDRRKRTRVPMSFDVTISVQGQDIGVETENLSLTGMLCKTEEHLPADKPCEVKITLNPEVVIVIQAKILRTEDKETAVSFISMGEDSFFHLKRLLQYNFDNADRIEEDLGKPAFE